MEYDGWSTERWAERALTYLDERGWEQGQYESEDGRVCLLGACALALTDGQISDFGLLFAGGSVAADVVESIRRCMPLEARDMSIEEWQDSEPTTVEDVRRVLKCVAEL